MPRPKSEKKFLKEDEVNHFQDRLIQKKGQTHFIRFVADAVGSTYSTISTKFKTKKVEISIKEIVDRVFENEDLRIKNSELEGQLAKARESLK
jgi:hypothetical protein